MSIRFGVHLILVASAFFSITACGDDIAGPVTVEGTYDLRRLNGQPLPYDHEGLGCCTYLEGMLDLGSPDYTIALTARNRNTGEVFTAREWGKYTRQGLSLTFSRDSFFIIGFLLDVARLSGDSVRVGLGGEGPGSPDQFQALFVKSP